MLLDGITIVIRLKNNKRITPSLKAKVEYECQKMKIIHVKNDGKTTSMLNTINDQQLNNVENINTMVSST